MAQQLTNRLREGYEAAWEDVAHRYRQAEGIIARNPSSAVLMGFGIGFGIGLVAAFSMFRREESWAQRHLPDSWRELPDRLQKARFADSLRNVGGSVHDSFRHLSESLRDLPSALARALPGH
jgi:hypothetical protein